MARGEYRVAKQLTQESVHRQANLDAQQGKRVRGGTDVIRVRNARKVSGYTYEKIDRRGEYMGIHVGDRVQFTPLSSFGHSPGLLSGYVAEVRGHMFKVHLTHPKGHPDAGKLTSPPDFEYVNYDNIVNHVDLSTKAETPEVETPPEETPPTEAARETEAEPKREQLTDFISWEPSTQTANVAGTEVSFDLGVPPECVLLSQEDESGNTRLRFSYSDENFLELSALGTDQYAFSILLQGQNPEVPTEDGTATIPLLGVEVKKENMVNIFQQFVHAVKGLDIVAPESEPTPSIEGEEENVDEEPKEEAIEQKKEKRRPDTDIRTHVDDLVARQLGRDIVGAAVDQELDRMQEIEEVLEAQIERYKKELKERVNTAILQLQAKDHGKNRLCCDPSYFDEKLLKVLQDTEKIQDLLSIIDDPQNSNLFPTDKIVFTSETFADNVLMQPDTKMLYINRDATPEDLRNFYENCKQAKNDREAFFKSLQALNAPFVYFTDEVHHFDQSFIDTSIGTEGTKAIKKCAEFITKNPVKGTVEKIVISVKETDQLFVYDKEQKFLIISPKAGWENYEDKLREVLLIIEQTAPSRS
ncbi:MAG: hypothetical protein COV59_01085 [Candidatus Magasanikbacteria bacterium CG11_big_fil_rev_8_21_14_0_20_39_34]|uniref:Uncharacterized protein n=1 Tax=Candidatus Magasanikbacteria bacterium CG11_big_fil_rev_8_21_14_0_20_39_34 TaxID=1974653 RepID=A0A2H0N6A4_9BACT|nr:MAG: hypothetical protein COV59_01085 [Candidatus Magasanikbacteria bacterium CG11_big_fil_rev_8_21_14_0_20_39_34]